MKLETLKTAAKTLLQRLKTDKRALVLLCAAAVLLVLAAFLQTGKDQAKQPAAHALSYYMTSHYGIPHGHAVYMMFEYVCRANGHPEYIRRVPGLATLAEFAAEKGISPEVLHRIASISSGGLDTLPHNGAVLTLLAVSHCSLSIGVSLSWHTSVLSASNFFLLLSAHF